MEEAAEIRKDLCEECMDALFFGRQGDMYKSKFQLRGVLSVMIGAVLLLSGCGDAGVENGVITGTVFSNRAGGATTKTPEPNVSVIAVFESEPQVIRTAVSNANGQYRIPNLRIGKWALGYSKDGFETIQATEKTATSSEASTAIGGTDIKVYVETASTIAAPDVTLRNRPPEGDGTVILNLVDERTGEAVNGATVSVGNSTTSNGSNGQYVLVVPIINPTGDAAPQSAALNVSAEGYSGPADGVSSLAVLAGQSIEHTVRMVPLTGQIEGQITLSKFSNLYDITQFRVTVEGLSTGNQANQAPNANGFFQVEVPVRTSTNNRSYTLRISGRGVFDQVVNNILAPIAGSVRVDVPPMTPQTVTIVGEIRNPSGNRAVITQLGLEGGVTGGIPNCNAFTNGIRGTVGSFSIDGVPVDTQNDLTVSTTVYNCDDTGLQQGTAAAQAAFKALNNGTGVFTVPTLQAGGGN